MAAVIQLLVEVDETGTVRGIAGIEGALKKTGQRGNVVFTGLTRDTQRARDAANLFSTALGVQVPRAMEKILARLPGVSGALGALFNVGAVLLFAGAIVNLVNNFDSVGEAIRRAGTQLGFFGERMREWVGFGTSLSLIGERVRKQQELALPLIERERDLRFQAAKVGVEGFRAIAIAREQELRQIDILKGKLTDAARAAFGETQTFEDFKVLIVQLATRAKAAAEELYRQQEIDLARKNAREILKLENQAEIAALEGLPRIVAEREAALSEIALLEKQGVVTKRLAEAQKTAAVAQAAAAEKTLRREVADTTLALERQGLLAGLRGIARIREERRQAIQENLEQLRRAGLTEVEIHEEMAKRIEAIDKMAAAKQVELKEQTHDIIRGLELDLAQQRAEATGNFVIIALAEEKRRVEETIEQMKRLGIAQEEIDRAVELIHQQTTEKIAADWADLTTDLITGARSWKDVWQEQLKALLRGFLQMIFRMVLNWIKGLEQMADAWDKIMGGLGSPGGGPGGLIIVNFTPSFQHGGLVDDVARRMKAIHSADGRLLAMLHRGEAVLNPGAVRLMGAGRINALNAAGGGQTGVSAPPSFQGGGLVGTAPAAPGPNGPIYVQMVFPGVVNPRGFAAALQDHERVIVRLVDRAKAERGF